MTDLPDPVVEHRRSGRNMVWRSLPGVLLLLVIHAALFGFRVGGSVLLAFALWAGVAIWMAGGVMVLEIPARPRGYRGGGGIEVRMATWRRVMSAWPYWPGLAVAHYGGGEVGTTLALLLLCIMLYWWIATGQRLIHTDAGIRLEGGFGRAVELRWGEIEHVGVHWPHLFFVGAGGKPKLGINALACDGGPEFAAKVVRTLPWLSDADRATLSKVASHLSARHE